MNVKKIEGAYSWATLLKINRDIGHFTGELLFSYPSVIERILSVWKTKNHENVIDACFDVINCLREEAESILEKRGYSTDLKKLAAIRDYDPVTDEEATADLQIVNAKQVLLSADALKKDMTDEGAHIFFATLKLLAASITTGAQPFTLRGIETAIGQDKSHTKEKLRGVLLAVEKTRQAHPNLAKKRLAIWDLWRHRDKTGRPWTTDSDGITYRITFRDKNTLVLTATTEKGEEAKLLKKSTFIQKYFAIAERNESFGCDENGVPRIKGRPWNKAKKNRLISRLSG